MVFPTILRDLANCGGMKHIYIVCFTFGPAGKSSCRRNPLNSIHRLAYEFHHFSQVFGENIMIQISESHHFQSCWQRLPGKCDWNRPSFKLLQFVDVLLLVSFRIAWPFHRQTLNVASSSKPNDAWCAWLAQMKQHSNTYSYRWHIDVINALKVYWYMCTRISIIDSIADIWIMYACYIILLEIWKFSKA